MLETKLPNAGAHMMTVSSSAVSLETLITAAAGETFKIPNDHDAVDLFGEVNDVRWLSDDNDPTTASGHLLAEGGVTSLRGESIKKMKLIATGSDATVSVRIGINS